MPFATTQRDYITLPAGEDLVQNRLVELRSDGVYYAPVDTTGQNYNIAGVTLIDASGGDPVSLALIGSTTSLVEASAAISVGDLLTRAGSGKVKEATSGDLIVGQALTAAENGSICECQLSPAGWGQAV